MCEINNYMVIVVIYICCGLEPIYSSLKELFSKGLQAFQESRNEPKTKASSGFGGPPDVTMISAKATKELAFKGLRPSCFAII